MSISNKEKVLHLLKSFETGDNAPVSYVNPQKYIQHNVSAPDGLAGFLAMRSLFPPGAMKVKKVRLFEDRDHVFAHMEYEFFGPKIAFDVFRFENGLIVEHWDNLQETAGPNPSNHSMTDGPTESTDIDKTEANKQLVKRFVDEFFVKRNMERLEEYIDENAFTQHNPSVGDGISNLRKAAEYFSSQGFLVKFDKVHKILGEGNFVLVMSEGSVAEKHSSFYNLFRVDNGKIVEHWDTIETIPPRSEWKNQHGKF